ncbi:MAG: D-aminoacyl-tRNA deacylase [Ruminococcus sp.]|nr:D-aminoacyl-tRNA deacylase [Ruminococcus sp.]
MKAVIQRVTQASVTVDNNITGQIGHGFLILLGAGSGDTEADCEKLAEKISKLRIFSDENDKINLSVNDINGDILVVSQFTLYADCRKGNRPSFINACPPAKAEELYEYFMKCLQGKINGKIEHGVFGADMKVSLLNDGPFTVVLNCENGEII